MVPSKTNKACCETACGPAKRPIKIYDSQVKIGKRAASRERSGQPCVSK